MWIFTYNQGGEETLENHGFELDDNWESPSPESIMESSLKAACDYVESKKNKEWNP
jgi:hypothetical protein